MAPTPIKLIYWMLILCQTWDYLIYSLCSRYYYPNFMGNFAQFAQVYAVQSILYQAILLLFQPPSAQLIYIAPKLLQIPCPNHPSPHSFCLLHPREYTSHLQPYPHDARGWAAMPAWALTPLTIQTLLCGLLCIE